MEILLSISGAVILILLSIISFFLIRHINGQDNINDKLLNAISGFNAIILDHQYKLKDLSNESYRRKQDCGKKFEKLEKLIEK